MTMVLEKNAGSAEPALPVRRLIELLRRLSSQGISQAQVARRANVTPQYLSDISRGRRPVSELFARRLAEEFAVDYLWLLGVEDMPERPVLSGALSTGKKIWLPVIGEAIAGDPREHPKWSGTYVEVSGVAAAKAARAVQPYVLQLGHGDRDGRLMQGDFILVTQAPAERAVLTIVSCGRKVWLARKKRGRWIHAATGKPLRGDCEVTGHCLGVVWSALM